MGEVVYGIDFKAKAERVLTIEEQSLLMQATVDSGEFRYDLEPCALPADFPIQYRRDTAPSEMNCDSGDCA
jgi:hypothetical protein